MIGHMAARELRTLFLSPLAWSILAVVQFILGFLFLGQLDEYIQLQPRLAVLDNAPGITEIIVAPLLASAAIILLLVTPLLTMRLVSDERRSSTLPLLLSAPVSMTEIIMGKYLGVLGFLATMVALIALMPLSLLFAGSLDPGLLASAFLGLALILASFAAAGLYISTLTAQPTVAAVGSFGLLFVLWIIDWAGGAVGDGGSGGVFEYLSLQRHFEAMLRGIFDTSDVIYFVLFIMVFLTFSIRRLDADRLQH
jgi:ABC-2 type transport system permease protein